MNVKRIKERKVNLQTRMSVHSNMQCINVNIYVEMYRRVSAIFVVVYLSIVYKTKDISNGGKRVKDQWSSR